MRTSTSSASFCSAPAVGPRVSRRRRGPLPLLRAYVTEAKRRGLAVVCDEVMCGLEGHGQDPRGATGCFLTGVRDLRPDVVTFGKSVGGGAGHLLSGAILLIRRIGARRRLADRVPVTHLRRVLREGHLRRVAARQLESLRADVRRVEAAVKPALDALREESGGRVLTQGQWRALGRAALESGGTGGERAPRPQRGRGRRVALLRAQSPRLHADAALRR